MIIEDGLAIGFEDRLSRHGGEVGDGLARVWRGSSSDIERI